jgi:hypothetical protein
MGFARALRAPLVTIWINPLRAAGSVERWEKDLGTRSHTTFKKRQKEQARSEKAREKQAERLERKLTKGENAVVIDSESDLDDHSLDVIDINAL